MKEGWPHREREEDTHKILFFDGPAHVGCLFTGEGMKMLIYIKEEEGYLCNLYGFLLHTPDLWNMATKKTFLIGI